MTDPGTATPPRRPTLGVVAIARNERRDIDGFIRNLEDWVDEIVVVDDHSTDGTFELLRDHGGKVRVIQRKLDREQGGFAAQRNAGLAVCTTDWVLHMDIDERVTPELADEMRGAIAATQLSAFRYHRLNFFLHRPFDAGGWQNWNAPQFARRGKHRFAGAIHETIELDDGPGSAGQLGNSMWHLNDEDYVERMSKNVRYAQFSADAIMQRGVRVRWHHLLLIPLYRALKGYFLRGGWRHGEAGLVFAIYSFYSSFNWYAVAWDRQTRIPRQEIERKLEEKWQRHARGAASSGNPPSRP
jgi:glycosyltransferase involved in cell wall biosynthesis